MAEETLVEFIDPLTIPQGKGPKGKGLSLEGQFDSALCDELASRFGFVSVSHVSYQLTIKLISKDCWALSGTIDVRLTQSCVASFEPVKEAFKAEIYERFVTNFEENEEIDVQDASVEPLINGQIPLKEALFQFVGVQANPYPRVDEAPETYEFGPKIEKENPFSKLKRLKKT